MRKSLIAAGAAAAILAAPSVASAHVTVNPREAPAGGFTVLNVRVPNERDNKGHGQGRPAPPRRVLLPELQEGPGMEREAHAA